jgi:hypothetical protein
LLLLTAIITLGYAADMCVDTTAEAVDKARDLEHAFMEAQEERFLKLHNQLQVLLPCMTTAPTVLDVAQLHRAMGIWQFVSGQHGAAKGSFAAVQQLSPNWRLISWGLPEDHRIIRLWNEAPKDTTRKVMRGPPGGWVIDGQPNTTLPTARPALVQGYHVDGSLWMSSIVASLAEIPEPPVDEAKVQRRRNSVHIVGTAIASTLIGGGAAALGVAESKNAALNSQNVAYDDIAATVNSRNDLRVVGGTLLGVGTTLGTVTWVVKW